MVTEIGWFKASDSNLKNQFGMSVSISNDSSIMAVGVPGGAHGVIFVGKPDPEPTPGSVYIFKQSADG
jgi:hypothetical protein